MTTATHPDLDECRHGLEPRFCSICRNEAGYQPGKDRRRNDCTVMALANITGADYEDIVQLLAADHGYRPGHGLQDRPVTQALLDLGYRLEDVTYTVDYRDLPEDGTYLVMARTSSKGHAFTSIDGTVHNALGWQRLRSVRFRAWRVEER